MFKRHNIDEIEYPPSLHLYVGEKTQFELNITSSQFRQNALARGWPATTRHPLASAFWRG